MKILIATYNPAKMAEYKRYLSDLKLDLLSLADLDIKEEAPEDGKTFEENAIKKVNFFNKLSSLPVIADDGGLMIDALDGTPGVKSRRWLGYRMTDEEMIQSVIEKMKDVPDGERACHLVCVIALITPDNRLYTKSAQIDGVVGKEPTEKRIKGYPYRSIFYLPQFNKFYVELSDEEHNQVNQRRIALLKLKPYLLSFIKE